MSFKKFDGSTWQPITPKKLKGIPYTGTLPAVLTGTKAGYLHRYKIYGNTSQEGTPTPDNPIMPQECGERTENLFDEEYANISLTIQYRPIYVGIGRFTLSTTAPNNKDVANVFLLSGDVTSGASSPSNGTWLNHAVTAQSVDGYVTVAYRQYHNTISPAEYETMLNLGSTPLPYEPYGFKLPLASAGQNVDIYLGESQTTRRIKKLVLTGGESWVENGSGTSTFRGMLSLVDSNKWNASGICSHLKYIISGISSDVEGCSCVSNNLFVRLSKTLTPNLSDFKSYLAQQYASGTPVTVWYVLATEEAGTLNEPLRKIGDYADTIDSTQTSAQIPTSAGSTTISWAGSGLAPSEFDSIQEWVDIPTYTYTNGAWVEDN